MVSRGGLAEGAHASRLPAVTSAGCGPALRLSFPTPRAAVGAGLPSDFTHAPLGWTPAVAVSTFRTLLNEGLRVVTFHWSLHIAWLVA